MAVRAVELLVSGTGRVFTTFPIFTNSVMAGDFCEILAKARCKCPEGVRFIQPRVIVAVRSFQQAKIVGNFDAGAGTGGCIFTLPP